MMSFSSRLAIAVGCCLSGLLVASVPHHVLGSESDSNPPSRNEVAVRRRILAHWRERQEQSNLFHYAWDGKVTFPKAGNRPASEAHVELWMEGETRFRFTSSFVEKHENPGSTVEGAGTAGRRVSGVFACDGSTGRGLNLQAHSAIVVYAGEGQKRLKGDVVFPLLLALRPFSRGGVAQATHPLIVLNEDEIVDGRHCVKLKRDEADFADVFWVDPARDDVIVRWEALTPRTNRRNRGD